VDNSLGYCQKVEGARFTPAALRASSSAVAVPVVIRSPLPVKYKLPQLVAPESKKQKGFVEFWALFFP